MIPNLAKPSRANRLLTEQAERLERQTARLQESRRKQRQHYGQAATSEETWPQFKERIKARDGGKCVVPCGSPRLGLTVHHTRSVGSGGKNDERLCVTLCAFCHEAWHGGRGFVRDAVRQYLDRLYPPVTSDVKDSA